MVAMMTVVSVTIMPMPMPCNTREAMSWLALWEAPNRRLAVAKMISEAMKSLFLSKRSASLPMTGVVMVF